MNDNPLARLRDRAARRSVLAAQTYAALKATGTLSSHRLVTYRCPRRCLLLDIVQLPQGLIFHRPAYKLSPTINAASSNESGRRVNTTDGDRRWKANTAFMSEWGNVPLNCDHVRNVALEHVDVLADIDARRAEVTISAAGERCSE